MSYNWFRPHGGLVAFSLLLLISARWLPASAQDCQTPATALRETVVYNQPPQGFSTARGWILGTPLATLSPGVKVFICGEPKVVQFGFSSQAWQHIAYWQNEWRHGWVIAESIQRQASLGRTLNVQTERYTPAKLEGSILKSLVSIRAAQAQSAPAAPIDLILEGPPEGVLPPPFPVPQPSAQISEHPSQGESQSNSGLLSFYLTLFIAMIFGMLAKVIVDYLTALDTNQRKPMMRRAVVPLLVSPMVFLSFMQAADLTTALGVKAFIIIVLLAFQNGFFWQTVLVQPSTSAAGKDKI